MRAELRSLDSADVPEGLEGFRPTDAKNFALSIGATIGPDGGEGGDLFYFTVCTAEWLKENRPQKGFAFLHGHILVDRWDYQLVERAIADLCFRTEGAGWDKIATKLSRYAGWEFECYIAAE